MSDTRPPSPSGDRPASSAASAGGDAPAEGPCPDEGSPQRRPAARARAADAFPDPEASATAEALRLVPSYARRGAAGGVDLDAAARDLLVLQRGLTGSRAAVGSAYMDEARRLASYLLFYWHVSYAQVRGMLRMAFPAGAGAFAGGRGGPIRVLDLGSGPAPCALAAADWLRSAAPEACVSVLACDRSALALESARRLAEGRGIAFSGTAGWDAASPDAVAAVAEEGAFDVATVGHVVNELWAGRADRHGLRLAFLEAVLSRLKPGGLLVVLEPALLSTSRDMIALRDALAARGTAVLAPCLRQGPCPAVAKEGRTCHSDFAGERPRIVGELSARTGLDKDLVKAAGFVFSRGPAPAGSSPARGGAAAYRVVSERMLNKAGRSRLLLCGEAGLATLSAKKGEGFPSEPAFFRLARSDLVALAGAVERESGWALGPATTLETETF